jgi:hypothetical protein
MRRLPASLAAVCVFLICGAARAATIYFEESWNGAELAADLVVDFPAVVPATLDGTTLRWGAVPNNSVPSGSNGVAFVKFLEIPLIAAGVLQPNAKVRVTVDFQLARTAVQFGPALTIFDNDPSGSFYYGSQLRTDTRFLSIQQGRFGDGNPIDDIGDYSEFESGQHISPDFWLNTAPPDVIAGQLSWDYATDRFGVLMPGYESVGAGAGSPWPGDGPLVGNLNLARDLSFALWLHPTDDNSGGVTSLSLRVEQVPEPSRGAILMGSLIVAPAARRRWS